MQKRGHGFIKRLEILICFLPNLQGMIPTAMYVGYTPTVVDCRWFRQSPLGNRKSENSNSSLKKSKTLEFDIEKNNSPPVICLLNRLVSKVSQAKDAMTLLY